jgi:hypothetical protein
MTITPTEIKLEERVVMPTGRDIFDLTPDVLDDFEKSIQDIFNGSRGVLIFLDSYKLNESGIWTKTNTEDLIFKEIEPIDGEERYGIKLKFKTYTSVHSEFGVPIYMGQEPRFAFLMRKGGHSPAESRLGLYLSQAYTENIPNKGPTGREELIFL